MRFELMLAAAPIRWTEPTRASLMRMAQEGNSGGFPHGDDAFDAVVGLFGMLQVCLGQRGSGGPDDRAIREIEGWILGGKVSMCPPRKPTGSLPCDVRRFPGGLETQG